MGQIKFAVFTDLHFEEIHDGEKRLREFIHNIKNEQVDFIINLGDFCIPKEENRFLLDILKSTGKPIYNVIGNHDSDHQSKEKYLEFFGLNKSYYSFVKGNIKFIVLDSCYIKTEKGYKEYHKKNYRKTKDIYPVIPEEEIEWLKNELEDKNKYFIIFSHHSLENDFAKRGVYNRKDIRNIIDETNRKGKKVILCVNGHDHGDSIKKIGDTIYFGVNAMSYIWVGPEYEHFCYSKEIHKKYPYIKDLILYNEGLYGIVTIKEDGNIEIKGMEGSYQNVTPIELGLGDRWNGRSILPVISEFIE